MSREETHEQLEEAARRMAEGRAVDWDSAQGGVHSEDERRWLQNLRLVQAMVDAVHDADGTQVLGAELESAGLGAGDTPTLQSWGHLNLLERIGRGGFGDVYRAWDSRLNRPVALKLLRDQADVDTDEARVLDEARLLARVEHPYVARVYGVERHEDRAGIWMELVEGTDLRTLVLEGRPLEAEDVARLGRDIAEALAAVHAADVVHQDVKPQNVVVRPDGRVALMDFGAGRRRRFERDGQPRLVAGSPAYLAPELLLEAAPPAPSSDLYSLGGTLFFLLTGQPPVEGTLSQIAVAHRDGTTRRLQDLRADLPAELRRIVERCLAPRAERFATALEVRDALDAWLRARQPKPARARGAWALAAVLALALAGGAWWWSATRSTVQLPLSADVQLSNLDGGRAVPLELNAPVTTEDEVELQVQLTRAAHVYVINRDAQGNTVVLFPMSGGGLRNPLPAGRPIALPGAVDSRRMGWAFGPVAGPEDFLVIASAEPLSEFEAELTQVAQVDVGGGLSVQPLDGQAMQLAFRGVIGLVEVDEGEESPTDLFQLATHLQSDPSSQLWMQQLRLYNTGR